MVKLSGAKADQWIAKPGRNQHAVLLYGPNLGLVRERAKAMLRTWAGDAHDDPFAVATVDESRLKAEPSAIADEAFQQSFLGGAKVLWVTEAGDKAAQALADVLVSEVEPNPIVVEAGDLPPRSKLRQLFEKAENAAAIGCYDDDGRSIAGLIETRFREWGIRAGYIHGDNDWEVAVFGRNITDEENLKGGIDFNNNTAFDNEPRIWGITFRKNWGN